MRALVFIVSILLTPESPALVVPSICDFASRPGTADVILAAQGSRAPSAYLRGLMRQLGARGFRCTAPTVERGTQCSGRVPGYSQPVHLYIPWNYRQRERLDLALHLHGFNLGRTPFQMYFDPRHGRSDFGAFLTRAGRDQVIGVAPESIGDNTTFESELSQAPQIRAFLDQITGALQASGASTSRAVERLTLSAHSGAYRVLADWSTQTGTEFHRRYFSRVRGVGFFDSIYSHTPELGALARRVRDQGGLFFSVYQPAERNAPQNAAVAREAGAQITRYEDLRTPLAPGVRIFTVPPPPGVRMMDLHMSLTSNGTWEDFIAAVPPALPAR